MAEPNKPEIGVDAQGNPLGLNEALHPVAKNVMVDMVSPNGERYSVPSQNAELAIKKGFRIETEEEKKHLENQEKFGKGALNPLITGAESAASMATLGASDILLHKTGIDTNIQGRREANPTAHILGSTVGLVAPLAR